MTSYRKWLDCFFQEFVDFRLYIKSDSKLYFKLKMKRFQTMSMRAKNHPIATKKQPNWMPMPSWKYHPGNDCDVTFRTDTPNQAFSSSPTSSSSDVPQDGVDEDRPVPRSPAPNGRLFQAHKAILCEASNYFKTLFRDCWVETSQNVITLRGITDVVFEILLGTWS